MTKHDFLHVYPVNDTIFHKLQGMTCECKPRKEGCVIVHNAQDGREMAQNCLVIMEKIENARN